ncbi:MAG TPA: helix-turn-helix transcriptional regulator [bacterium]|nr:helix-turn-helix transcriptional regulator [bacterium]
MTRARSHESVANNGQRVESTHRGKPAPNTAQGLKPVKTAVMPRVRHRPVEHSTAPILAACRARFDESGLSIGDVARATALDKADLSRALNLREEPTPRTLGRLCEYFNVASGADLNRAERKYTLLIEIRAAAERQADLLGALAALAAGDDPPGI